MGMNLKEIRIIIEMDKSGKKLVRAGELCGKGFRVRDPPAFRIAHLTGGSLSPPTQPNSLSFFDESENAFPLFETRRRTN